MDDIEPTFGDGRYIVRRELGRGTMGVVYEAEDPVLARTVAVKTIDLLFAAGAKVATDFERRFFTEARVAAQLSHPGIVVCHDVGKDAASGRLFIVFEHLRGRTLEDRVAQGALPWREALAIVVQVARAIHHAHEHGVVHRDLKPANIMVLDRGVSGTPAGAGASVKIMDFGVARLESLGPRITKTGQAFGSPLYMSPEQALGQPSSARSDIFSLGSVLCTLVLGRPWFEAPNLPKIVDRLAHDDPPRLSRLQPGVPPSLDLVVAKALAKREDERYRTAAEMADDLDDVLAGRPARHAFGPASARGGASDEELLLAGLQAAPAGPRRPGPHDPLASLLDEPASPAPMPPPAGSSVLAATTPMAAPVPAPARQRYVAAAAGLALALVAATGAFVASRRARTPEPPPATVPPAPVETPALVAEREEPPPETTLPAPALPEPSAEPVTEPAATPTPRVVRPTATPIPTPVPTAEPAPAPTPELVAEPAPAAAASGSRIRLSLEHPFEDGRLIVWVDGVLVHEAKIDAPNQRRIVAFKVREGRAESMLDVTPGKHEVRVEVTWNQGRTTRTKVVDVAEGATGLLEAKVGRMSKELSLGWSRLAKE